MQYFIERRGGLAGLKASCTLEGDALDPDDREKLEHLLDSEEPVERGSRRRPLHLSRHPPQLWRYDYTGNPRKRDAVVRGKRCHTRHLTEKANGSAHRDSRWMARE